MKKLICMVLVVVLAITVTGKAKLIDKIVATVNGEPITLYELKNIAGFYNVQNPNQLLNKVIDDYLIMSYAKKYGITVTENDINNYIDKLAANNNMSPKQFIQKIKESGIDPYYYKKGIELILYRIKFARAVFLPSIKITDQQINNYLKLHKKQLENSGKIAVLSIITLNNLKEAQHVLKLLKKGQDFYKLLQRYSLTKEKVREIPISALNPYLKSQILHLKKGEYTNIIETNGKFYIVKLVNIKENSIIKQQIKNMLISKKIESKLNSWLKMVRARSNVEIFMK